MVLDLQENKQHYCLTCYQVTRKDKTEYIHYHNVFIQEFITKKPLCKLFYGSFHGADKMRMIRDFGKNLKLARIYLNYLNNYFIMHSYSEYIERIKRIELH